MAEQLRRHAVPPEQTWDLSTLYESAGAWEADVAALRRELADLARWQGRLAESPATLLGCLKARDAAAIRLGKVTRYALCHRDTDGDDPGAQAMDVTQRALQAEAAAATSFIADEIVAMPGKRLDEFLAAESGLQVYRVYLEDVSALAPHMLSPETEAAIAALGGTLAAPHALHKATATDMRLPPVEAGGERIAMSVARHGRLLTSPDPDVRRRAHASLGEGLDAHKTAMAAALSAHIDKTVTLARLRRYPSALAMHLEPARIPETVYQGALETLLAECAPHARRYVALRRRVLGLDRVHQYDLAAPLDPQYQEDLAFGDGTRQIAAGLAVLGVEYASILERAFTQRWVDWADNAGKEHGAYSAGTYGWHPVILMTWQNRVRDVFTLAHELGHTCHSYLSARYQAFINTRGPRLHRFFIECPSTCNEVLLSQHLLAQTSERRKRRQIIEAALGTYWHNMVNHLLQAEVERRLFALAEAGRAVTLAAICEAQAQTFAAFFGDTVVTDETDRLIWETVPHYYIGFYPLVYGVGLAAACAVAGAIRSEGLPAVERWLSALRAGSTLHPLDLYRQAGVDVADPAALRMGTDAFGRLVAELEESYA